MARRLSARDVIKRLDLKPHPEGGYFRETHRDTPASGGRAHSTAIYFLLSRGERSHWHRVDAVEVWHYYAGDPLELSIVDGSKEMKIRLGPNVHLDETPQAVVPSHAWQAAETIGDWTLVGCTVSPGFEFSGFELAPKGWKPD